MKPSSHFIVLSVVIAYGSCQRSPYAGRRPIGYPVIETTTSANVLGNKFGENVNATTQRLPIDALGDRELVNRLSQYPIDQQPFWLINWQALEEHRKRQQTFNIRPSVFANPTIQQNTDNQNNLNSMLNNRNGPNSQQNLRPNDQIGQNLQQKPNDQIVQSMLQNGQYLQQNLGINGQNGNVQSNLRLSEQNGQNSGQNFIQSVPMAQSYEQNLKTNLPNNRIVLQSLFPTTNQGIQVNPTPPQLSQAGWTMAANI